jgi:hypothetical protein
LQSIETLATETLLEGGVLETRSVLDLAADYDAIVASGDQSEMAQKVKVVGCLLRVT